MDLIFEYLVVDPLVFITSDDEELLHLVKFVDRLPTDPNQLRIIFRKMPNIERVMKRLISNVCLSSLIEMTTRFVGPFDIQYRCSSHMIPSILSNHSNPSEIRGTINGGRMDMRRITIDSILQCNIDHLEKISSSILLDPNNVRDLISVERDDIVKKCILSGECIRLDHGLWTPSIVHHLSYNNYKILRDNRPDLLSFVKTVNLSDSHTIDSFHCLGIPDTIQVTGLNITGTFDQCINLFCGKRYQSSTFNVEDKMKDYRPCDSFSSVTNDDDTFDSIVVGGTTYIVIGDNFVEGITHASVDEEIDDVYEDVIELHISYDVDDAESILRSFPNVKRIRCCPSQRDTIERLSTDITFCT